LSVLTIYLRSIEPDGVADADAEAEVVIFAVAVVDAACDVLPAAWLLLVDVVQPATNKEATTSKRTTIAVIDFSCIIGHLRK